MFVVNKIKDTTPKTNEQKSFVAAKLLEYSMSKTWKNVAKKRLGSKRFLIKNVINLS